MPRKLFNVAKVSKFANRIIALENEKETIAEDMKAVYEEAAEEGIDKKAMKVALKEKRKQIEKSHKLKVNSYLEALGNPPLFHE
jgi:uncharacterized protein (UPF0335 family)